MTAKYIVGIDLGTTNSVVAFTPVGGDAPSVELLPIPQLVAASTVEAKSSLPSFLYLANEAEAKSGAFDVPLQAGREFAVGEAARRGAAEQPERTIGAAKSWLCHSRVDRHQPILPWNAPSEVAKVSPVTASRRYLEHLAAAWQQAHPEAPLDQQQVVLTVPASFDASARELTREAALAAGLPVSFVLLEEPQAAVYSWLNDRGERWRRTLKLGDTLLVCDIGGGTSDFTLVGVAEQGGELVLQRIAVGNHLLVGGDNMDVALAHHVAGLFAQKNVTLDPWQSVSLWHSCRAAKETLLAPDGPKKHTLSVLGRGSKLIGKSVHVEVERQAVSDLLMEGFFPRCAASDAPVKRRGSGFVELGLTYEADTAITKHLATFLRAHGESPETPVRPTHVLFNGGVFKSEVFRARLLEVLGSFSKDQTPPQSLDANPDLDFAVARGAAAYGWAKARGGTRIRGGTARAYYVGMETAGLAVPGAPRPLRAVCVVPMGMEEGTELDVPTGEIGLVVGEPATFRFFSSATRKTDKPGDLLSHWTEEELAETDSLQSTLPAVEGSDEGYVPVRFRSKITELGMLELWSVGTRHPGQWKLEFSVREE